MDFAVEAYLEKNLVAPYVGMILATTIYGVTCLQTFIFFGSGRADGCYLKATIAFLCSTVGSRIADTVHEALIAHTLYIYISSSYHNRAILYRPPWSTLVQMYFAAASDFTIRLIYSRRIYILLVLREKKTLAYLLVAIINSLSIASTGLAFAFATIGGLGCCAAADFIIAISLSVLLISSRTGIPRSDSMISFLVALAINTGLLTSLCALGCLIAFAVSSSTMIYFGFYILLTKLYFNALLASLNARGIAKGIADGTSAGRIPALRVLPGFHRTKGDSDFVDLSSIQNDRER
ncbi:hypothetical protein NLJ89_g9761 [Agrocybe chaxingu]|uniref:DUF6534 domain-containing protein n=1 Tax=Agrocybe chaxingu TaxID=84603 RepID=A0A9W8MQX1_9AGAR|nr:hypothetical protein NLJ89_g9761 [Agrocybe chaxingu]